MVIEPLIKFQHNKTWLDTTKAQYRLDCGILNWCQLPIILYLV